MLDKTPIQVRLTAEERDAVDNFRRRQQNPPTRAEAARQLIRRALSQSTDAGEHAAGAAA